MPAAVTVFRTEKNSKDRLAEKEPLQFLEQAPDMPSVLVDPQHRFQVIEGFGGAFTESAADTFYKASAGIPAEILEAYFDPPPERVHALPHAHQQLRFLARATTPMTEVPGDFELKHFSIERDRRQLIPLIQEATRAAGGPLKIFASPWSPPAWMKTNGQMNSGGKLQAGMPRGLGAIITSATSGNTRQEGIPIWGLTRAERTGGQPRPGIPAFTPAEEQRDFVPRLSRPGARKGRAFGRIKLLIWDHNRDLLFERAKTVYDDPEAARYVWGAAFHWYMGDHFRNVQATHDAYPEKQLLFSEGCVEGRPPADEWEIGERYGRSLLGI